MKSYANERMFSVLTVKAVKNGSDERVIEGVATTPKPDRVGDIVEPMGIKFTNPLPLLHQHNHDEPVGTVEFDPPTPEGIRFLAKLAEVDEPGALKERIDLAWQEVKSGLVRGVSIGFRSLEHAFMDDSDANGIRFIRTEVFELSLVTIPANADATITSVKAHAAHGSARPKTPATAGSSRKPINLNPKGNEMANLSERIAALEAKRAANSARMAEIMEKTAEDGVTTDEAQAEEFDALEEENKQLVEDIARWKMVEADQLKSAKPVKGDDTPEGGSKVRGARIEVKRQDKLAPGVAFARIARVKTLSKIDFVPAAEVAKNLYGEQSTTYGHFVKAAVAGATTTDADYSALVDDGSAAADFVEFLRSTTIIGQFGLNGVPALRQVPFRRRLPGQTGGSSASWVGEASPKPLTRAVFGSNTLEPLKVAAITVTTDELVRDSSPSAEILLRDDLAEACQETIDTTFIDPAVAAVANVSPASVTNGAPTLASSGTDGAAVRTDLTGLIALMKQNNNKGSGIVFVMSETNAMYVSAMTNPLGNDEFGNMGMMGGALFSRPVITSDYVGETTVVGINAREVWLGDEGGVDVDMSREASLIMDDDPAGVAAPAPMRSMFQNNEVAIRAERTINWQKRRPEAVAYLTGVAWRA